MSVTLEKLHKSLAAQMTALRAHEENVAKASALFADGKLDQADLDQAIRERDAALSRRDALQIAIKTAEARETDNAKQAAVDARKTAVSEAEKLLDERGKCAEDLDSAINALVATLVRFDELNSQIFTQASAAGVDLHVRQHTLNMRAVGGLLTTKLARAYKLAEKMDINVSRFDAFADVSTLTDYTGNQLRSHLGRVK